MDWLGAWLLALVLLSGAARPATADAPASNVSLPDLARSFWTNAGLRLPSRELVQAVGKAKLAVLDAAGRRREVVLMTIASEHAFERMMGVFCASLHNITFPAAAAAAAAPGGSVDAAAAAAAAATDTLARHTVINIMNRGAADKCALLAAQYGVQCVMFANDAFTSGNIHTFTNDFFGIGFTKTATILDGLTLGVDVLFLDADQVMFKNPLPYLLAREADVMVSGDCHNHDDMSPQERLPPINNNIGFVYFRPTAMVARAVYNWATHLAAVALRGEKPWDQNTFAPCLEWLGADVGVRHLSMAMLRPDLFPYLCMSACGCDLRNVPYFQNGKLPAKGPDQTCDPVLMRGWFNYHVPCWGPMNEKARVMQEYVDMYIKVIGPINSLSAPMTLL